MAGNDSNNTNLWGAPTNSTDSNYTASEDAVVIGVKGEVSIQRGGETPSALLNNGDAISLGDSIQTGMDAAVVIRFASGSLLTLGHEQSAKIDAAMLRMLQSDNVQQVAEETEEDIDFAKLEEGLEQGLNLEELLPATAAGGAPGAGGGGNGSSAGTGVRFTLTGDETLPNAGFETGTFGNGLDNQQPENDITDTAPEAQDDIDQVSSLTIATGNVVTGIDVGGDANTLDGVIDDPGANGFADIIVVGVASGDTQADLSDGSGVGVSVNSDKGTLLLNGDGSYSYTPNRTASGEDVFTYTIVDNDDDLSSATLTIQIDATPDLQLPPSENPDTPEGNALANAQGTAVFEAGLSDGTGELADGDGTNNSDAREQTSGVISFFEGDGQATVTIAGVTVALDGVQQATTITGSFGVLQINSVSSTEINYSYTLSDAVDHSAGPVSEVFSVVVSDADGNALDDVTDDLIIRIIDDEPIANSQEDSIDETLQATGNVLSAVDIPAGDANDTDGVADIVGADDPGFIQSVAVGDQAAESGGVAVPLVSDKGTLILQADGSYTYTANPGVFGEDVFTYLLSDADGSTNSATLTINVDAANTLADADEAVSGLQGDTIAGNVLDNSANPDGPEDAIVLGFTVPGDATEYVAGDTATIAGIGAITIAEDGAYTFTPLPTFDGIVPPITYTVSDGLNEVDSTLNLTVIDPLVPPVAVSDIVSSAVPGSTVVVSVLSNDSDPDGTLISSTVVISGAPGDGKTLDVAGQGTWQVSPAGEISFTPEVGFIDNPDPITYTVNDDDGLSASAQVSVNYQVNVTVEDISVNEGDDAVFSIQVSNAEPGSVINLSLQDGAGPDGANAPFDYQAGLIEYSLDNGLSWTVLPASGDVDLPAGGSPLILLRTDTVIDNLDENNERFDLTVSLTSGSDVVDRSAQATILDGDQANIAVSGQTVNEGTNLQFQVDVQNSAINSSVTLQLIGGSGADAAVQGVDFNTGLYQYRLSLSDPWQDVPATGVITLAAGGNQTVFVQTNTEIDNLDENLENLSLSAELNSNGALSNDSAQGFIADTNTPTINVGQINTGTGDVTVNEGEDAIFGVLVGNAAIGATVTLSLSDGSASSPLDYNTGNFQYREAGTTTWLDVPANGQITLINGGNQTLDVRTNTVVDILDEATEQFTLTADLSSNASNVSDSGNGFILDLNEPTVSVGQPNTGTGDVTVDEGQDAVFGVVVGNAAAGSTLTLSLIDGSANSPLDYNTGDFQYREAGTTAWIDVPANGEITLTNGGNQTLDVRTNTLVDALDEPTEQFTLNADLNSNGTNINDAGNGFIRDTNAPSVNVGQPNTGTGDVTVDEGQDTVFGVVVGNAAAGSTLTLSLSDGSANSPQDYNSGDFQYREAGTTTWIDVPANGEITLTNGGNQTLDVRTNTLVDNLDENSETFTLTADLNSNGTDVSDNATGTINDTNEPTVNVGQPNTGTGDVTVDEGQDTVFGVVVGNAAAGSTLTLSLSDGSANSPQDYNSGDFQYREAGTTTWVDVPANGEITLTNGGNQTLDVRTNTLVDNLDENSETFTLTADLNSNGTDVSDNATGTINDTNEPTVNVGQPNTGTGDVTVDEGQDTVFGVVVGNAAAGSTLTLSLVDGSANSPLDYNTGDFQYREAGTTTWIDVPANGEIALTNGGNQTLDVRTNTLVDNLDENSETFTLTADLNSNGTDVSDTATGTINDTNVPTVNVGQPNTGTGDVTVDEGQDTVFGVVVGNAAAGSTLTLSLVDGSANSPLDYNTGDFQYREAGTTTWIDVPANGEIALTNGGNQTLDVRTNTLVDNLDENSETFTLTADLNSNGTDVSDNATGTINDTNEPTVNVGQPNTGTGDVTVDEGQDTVFGVVVGNAAAGSTLTLSLSDGSANSPQDYNSGDFQYREAGTTTWIDVPANGEITLTNGGSQTLDVRTNTLVDNLDENSETFTLTADLNSNGTDVSDNATGTINDTNEPTVNVGQPNTGTGDVTVDEGQDTVFGVVVGNAAAGSTLTLSLSDGSANSPQDYNSGDFQYREAGTTTWIDVPANGEITLTNGGNQTLDVRTNTLVDNLDENSETFTLTADLNSNGTDVSDTATGTINDTNEPTVNVGQPGTGTGDVTVDEGQDTVFGVVVGNAAAGSTLTLSLSDGSANSPQDYNSGDFQYREAGTTTWIDVPANGEITLTNGGNQTLDVRTNTLVDNLDENSETFTLTADLNSNGTDVSDTATGTINDTNEPTVNVGQPNTGTGDVTVDEGQDTVFGVVVGNAAAGSTLTLSLSDGSANSPQDYNSGDFQYREAGTTTWIDVPANGEITLTSGGNQTLDVRTNTLVDDLDENSETFILTADLNSNGTDVSDTATGTINDTNEPTVNVGQPNTGTGDVTVDEGQDTVFGVVVGNAAAGSTLTLSLSDGSANSPQDYNSGDFQYREAGTTTWIDVPANGEITLTNGGNQTLDVRTNTLVDDLDENSETFILTADLNSNGTDVSDTATGTINDTNEPTISVGQPNTGTGDVTVNEGENAVFGVLVGEAALNSQVELNLIAGTAGTPGDFNAALFQYRLGDSGPWVDLPANRIIDLPSGGNQLIQVRTDTVSDLIDEADETFTLSAELSSNGSNVSDTGLGTILDNDETPDNLQASSATVSEEGITPAGLPDSIGSPTDTTDSASATGTISFDDAGDNNPFTVSLSGPSGISSAGNAVVWSYDSGSRTLTGSYDDNGTPVTVATVVLDPLVSNAGSHSMDYTVTFERGIDHPVANVEDVLDLQFGISIDDGVNPVANSNFTVSVEDDSPLVEDVTRQIEVPPAQTNLMIVLDISGSMAGSNLALAKEAINRLIDTYEANGDVRVTIVGFSTSASVEQPYWQSSDAAKLDVDALSAGGWTNYDGALALAQTAYTGANNGNMLANAKNVLYFLSDGEPTAADGDVNVLANSPVVDQNSSPNNPDFGIQANEESAWIAFLNSNGVDAYSFGMGTGPTLASLNPIAFDGENGVDKDAIQVDDLNDLDDALQSTVEIPEVDGNLLGNLGGLFGADGGIILEFVDRRDTPNDSSDDVLYRYNRLTDEITNTQTGAVISGQTLVVTTALGAELTVDMVSGDYAYQANYQVTNDVSEYFGFRLLDVDGDVSQNSDPAAPDPNNALLTFNVTRASSSSSPFRIQRGESESILEEQDNIVMFPVADGISSVPATLLAETPHFANFEGLTGIDFGDILDTTEAESLDHWFADNVVTIVSSRAEEQANEEAPAADVYDAFMPDSPLSNAIMQDEIALL
ncbi:retention module-containing protein [uncultured Pseudoteredinibacter sp.]|uniref:retention module-containing protein n=1 Tax=uncultured Pseudoteredinibacter sp. TaxID=1641701 RepID=UPI002621B208|nr:retention module-containing protein [uncultured Pseudoteredinibacter sp.]